jgi:hypothetical protein
MNTARLRRALFILRAIAGVSWLAALVLAAGGARAQEGESERQPEAGTELESPAGARAPDERRVAVLILAAGGVDADSADALTELAIGSVASRGGIRIVGKEELQAQLDRVRELRSVPRPPRCRARRRRGDRGHGRPAR